MFHFFLVINEKYILFLAHQGRVVDLVFSVWSEWVLSVGRDKYFQWHCSETGQRQGGFQCNAWCTAVQYPYIKLINYFEICLNDIFS